MEWGRMLAAYVHHNCNACEVLSCGMVVGGTDVT